MFGGRVNKEIEIRKRGISMKEGKMHLHGCGWKWGSKRGGNCKGKCDCAITTMADIQQGERVAPIFVGFQQDRSFREHVCICVHGESAWVCVGGWL